MSRALGWRALLVFAILAALPALPFMSKYYLLLTFDALLFGAIAMSLDLLIGYTGLVSFGHAAFYGLGAYATAVLLERGVLSVWAWCSRCWPQSRSCPASPATTSCSRSMRCSSVPSP